MLAREHTERLISGIHTNQYQFSLVLQPKVSNLKPQHLAHEKSLQNTIKGKSPKSDCFTPRPDIIRFAKQKNNNGKMSPHPSATQTPGDVRQMAEGDRLLLNPRRMAPG